MSRLAVSRTRPRPTRCAETTRPSTGTWVGNMETPSQVGDSRRNPDTDIPDFALYDETGWLRRTQSEVPAGSCVQPKAMPDPEHIPRRMKTMRYMRQRTRCNKWVRFRDPPHPGTFD